uniref:Uncharacterized protein n=1 Tax=Schistosoma curassoni TaxID=6186 RepID=A0A183KU56_9TREM
MGLDQAIKLEVCYNVDQSTDFDKNNENFHRDFRTLNLHYKMMLYGG